MAFCLIKSAAENFRQLLRSGKIDPSKLVDMGSEERRAFFSDIVGKENATDVNALFESKLLLKNQNAGFMEWAKSVSGIGKVKPDLVARIEKLDRVLNPVEEKAFLKDLAAKKLGTDVSFEQVKKISELTSKLKEVSADKDQIGNHTLEYFKRLKDTQDYVKSLNENPLSHHAVSLFRNFLLASIKTPLKVITEMGLSKGLEGAFKRLAYRSLKGLNPELTKAYVKNATEIYHKTGFNLAAMNSMTEGSMFGDLFSHHEGSSTGLKSIPRKLAKAVDTAVIHYGHGIVFSKVFNSSFASTVDLMASKIAREEGLSGPALKSRAAELSKEAMTVGTQDKIGKQIRTQAQQDAMRVTNTNDTYGSVIAKALKGALNKAVPGLPVGDALIPFSKIPGSIAANSIDASGLGIVRSAFQFKKAITIFRATGKADFVQPTRTLIRTMGTMGAALWIASNIAKNDYDEKKGMVRIGNHWVSLELFGPLGPAISGFIQAKEAKPGESFIYNYAKGATEGLKKLPGLSEINSIKDYGVKDFAKNFVSSRVSPAIIGDVQKSLKYSSPLPVLFGAKVKSNDQMIQEAKDKQALKAKQKVAANEYKSLRK